METQFITSDDVIETWYYEIKEVYLLFGSGEKYEVPKERITGLSMDNDYESNIFPICKINMTLESNAYESLIKNKKDTKLHLWIVRYCTNKEDDGSEKKSLYKDYICDLFQLIIDEEDLSPNKNLEKETKENLGDSADTNDNRLENISLGGKNEFFLYKQSTFKAMKKTINVVLKNVTMLGAVAYITSTCDVKNILASPFENNKTYQELLIPPQTALSAVQYLDTEYGFYKCGSMIFFGIDRAYFLNYKGGCTAWENKEIKETAILVPTRGGQFDGLSGSIRKKDQNEKCRYICCRTDSVDVSDRTSSNDMIGGNNATIINTNTKTVVNATVDPNANSQIIKTNTSNEWLATTYAAQSSANSIVISCGCTGLDVSVMQPNRNFTFLFEDTKNTDKYKGNYMLTRSTLVFTKDGRDMSVRGNFTFKRSGITSTVSVNDN